jgi:hypothetical protein
VVGDDNGDDHATHHQDDDNHSDFHVQDIEEGRNAEAEEEEPVRISISSPYVTPKR